METDWLLDARNGQTFEPKWRPRYSNQQRILTVGDGDFSFSLCVATEIGVAYNMVATSLDTRGELWQKYGMDAELNLSNLTQRGVRLVFHGFDACKMASEVTEQTDLVCAFQMSYFDRIIFNFPHAGFLGREDDPNLLMKHKELLRLFFANARKMLLPGGQVHVSHKLGHPYDEWQLQEQAGVSGLRLVAPPVAFHREHYPGYQNRRGDGARAGESFKLGPAATYIFTARIEVPPTRTWNVACQPLGMSISMQAHVKSLKQKAVYKARASQRTSLQQVLTDEVIGLKKLRLGKKKMKTLATLKPISQKTNLEKPPTSLSCTTKESPARILNVCEPVGMSITMLAQLKSLKEKAVCKAGASEETSLQQVVANEVTRLEKLKKEEKLGKKKVKTLETLKSALQQMNSENSSTSLSCTTKESPASTLNVCEPVGMSIAMLAQLESLKEKAVCKAGASEETSLQQVIANEVTRLKKLKEEEKLGKKKAKTLETLKSALQQMNLENSPTSLSCTTKESPARTLNVCEPVGMNSTTTKLKWVGCKAGTSQQVSSLQHVVADEETGLEKLQLGKKKMKTLETPRPALQQMNLSKCQGPLEALGEDLGGSLEEEYAKIIAMDLGSAGTISTVKKIEEEVKEDCTTSKQRSPLLEIQQVASLQRNVSCAVVDKHVNSALNVGHDPVGMSSTILAHLKSLQQAIRKARASQVNPLQQVVADEVARLEKLKEEEKLGKKKMKALKILKSALQQTYLDNFQLVEASVEALAQDLGIYLEEENKEIVDMGHMAVSASLSSAADTEWGSQSSGCSKSLIPETVDPLFQVNPGKEAFDSKGEDPTKSHDILRPSPQFSRLSADTISTVDKVDSLISKPESQLIGLQLVVDVAPLQRKMKENSGSKERSGSNEESDGGNSDTQLVKASVWRLLQGFFQKRE